ncbi:MAG: hypothetical protein HDKAJFGB_01528 [Anaerolineae bacterium]|nr:hypothetical protein [Anaerolineae bacterium]
MPPRGGNSVRVQKTRDTRVLPPFEWRNGRGCTFAKSRVRPTRCGPRVPSLGSVIETRVPPRENRAKITPYPRSPRRQASRAANPALWQSFASQSKRSPRRAKMRREFLDARLCPASCPNPSAAFARLGIRRARLAPVFLCRRPSRECARCRRRDICAESRAVCRTDDTPNRARFDCQSCAACRECRSADTCTHNRNRGTPQFAPCRADSKIKSPVRRGRAFRLTRRAALG